MCRPSRTPSSRPGQRRPQATQRGERTASAQHQGNDTLMKREKFSQSSPTRIDCPLGARPAISGNRPAEHPSVRQCLPTMMGRQVSRLTGSLSRRRSPHENLPHAAMAEGFGRGLVARSGTKLRFKPPCSQRLQRASRERTAPRARRAPGSQRETRQGWSTTRVPLVSPAPGRASAGCRSHIHFRANHSQSHAIWGFQLVDRAAPKRTLLPENVALPNPSALSSEGGIATPAASADA